MEIVGEASKHIPASVTAAYSDIEWNKIKDFRNIIAHDYDDINLDLVWITIQEKLPALKAAILDIKNKLKE